METICIAAYAKIHNAIMLKLNHMIFNVSMK